MREIERLLLEAGNRQHPAAMNALGTLYEHADPVGTSGVVRTDEGTQMVQARGQPALRGSKQHGELLLHRKTSSFAGRTT